MVEKLKLVLKTPKLRLGVKAIILALSLSFLPLWASVVVAIVLYFQPMAFSFSFLGTLISFLIIVITISPLVGEIAYVIALSALSLSALFYLILGVKNKIFLNRSLALFTLLAVLISSAIWGFFSGNLSLPVLILLTFLVSRDALVSFAPTSGRATLFAGICSLVVVSISWSVWYLNIPVWLATITVFLPFIGVLYMIVKYFQGELFKSDAPFIAIALAIISYTLWILTAF